MLAIVSSGPAAESNPAGSCLLARTPVRPTATGRECVRLLSGPGAAALRAASARRSTAKGLVYQRASQEIRPDEDIEHALPESGLGVPDREEPADKPERRRRH